MDKSKQMQVAKIINEYFGMSHGQDFDNIGILPAHRYNSKESMQLHKERIEDVLECAQDVYDYIKNGKKFVPYQEDEDNENYN